MNILITGGTGFIGTELRRLLLRQGHFLTVVSRSPARYESEKAKNQTFIAWDADFTPVMEDIDVVINLVGENIFGQRWSDAVKQRIYNSRIENTQRLVEAIGRSDSRPQLMISASAVGYYGDRDDEPLNEHEPPGGGFLSQVCVDWEKAAEEVQQHGVRLAIPRIGIVLDTGGGALQQMLPPFKLFVGGPVGDGSQYFPWIHMRDLCRGLVYSVSNESFEGAYNLNAPNPVTMREFADALGEVLNRPSLFRVPEFVLNIVLGEAADPITDSINARPNKLLDNGFAFDFPYVREALADIL